MNERIDRVLKKMEDKGLSQLLVSDPLSIRFLTGIMVNPGERLYALLLRANGKHTLFLNYLYYVSYREYTWNRQDMAGSFLDPASGALPEDENNLGI